MILVTLSFLSHLVHWKAYAIIFLTNVKRYPGIRTEIRKDRLHKSLSPQLKIHFYNQLNRGSMIKRSQVQLVEMVSIGWNISFSTKRICFVQTTLGIRVRTPDYLLTLVKNCIYYSMNYMTQKLSVFKTLIQLPIFQPRWKKTYENKKMN